MSLRRSSRVTTSQKAIDLPAYPKKANKRAKSEETSKVKVEESQQGLSIGPEPTPDRDAPKPKNWDVVYDLLRVFREKEKAPVDTVGCERLADTAATPLEKRFQTLVALMLSSQTKDTVTGATIAKLKRELDGGLNLQSILKVEESTLDKLISSVGFHTRKASYIKRTAEILRDNYAGDIPDTIEGLVSLPGVGPKMGYLTLQVAWDKNIGIGVDVHVHRICNRLGWVETKTPEETRKNLQSWLPKENWKAINPMMVGYGQIVCLPRGPRCDICPVSQFCPSSEINKLTKRRKLKTESSKVKTEPIEDEPQLNW
ncbi:DNA glycosylase [Choanephora cucurbitarum]|nr:DNA glycosylase [Choanephora cucurbitarum]